MFSNARRLSFVLATCVALSWCCPAAAEKDEGQGKTFSEAALIQNIKKSVVFLGIFDRARQPIFIGTGCLLSVGEVFHLITAKHVVSGGEDLWVFFNKKDGTMGSRSINEIRTRAGVDWIFANDDVDIAIIPFGLNSQTDDVKVIPENLFMAGEEIHELYDVFYISYQPGTECQERISPTMRVGIISRLNDNGTIMIDGFAFNGNSGSPVFIKPSAIGFDEEGRVKIGWNPLGFKFLGIIAEYVPFTVIQACTPRNCVTFGENTGLSIIWPAKYVRQLIDSATFQRQLKKLKERTK